MHIRPAARHDVAAIVALLADDVLGAQREANTDPLPDAYFDAFERIDADPNQELVVARTRHSARPSETSVSTTLGM